MIESVRAKADDLATNSPVSKPTTDTSQILNKYQIIKDQAMVRFNKYILNTCLICLEWNLDHREKILSKGHVFLTVFDRNVKFFLLLHFRTCCQNQNAVLLNIRLIMTLVTVLFIGWELPGKSLQPVQIHLEKSQPLLEKLNELRYTLLLCCLNFFFHLCFAFSSQFNNHNSNSYVDSYEIFVYLLSTVIYRCPDFQRWERVCFDFVWHFKTVPITCICRLRIKKKRKKMQISKVSFSQVLSGFKHQSSCELTYIRYLCLYVCSPEDGGFNPENTCDEETLDLQSLLPIIQFTKLTSLLMNVHSNFNYWTLHTALIMY